MVTPKRNTITPNPILILYFYYIYKVFLLLPNNSS